MAARVKTITRAQLLEATNAAIKTTRMDVGIDAGFARRLRNTARKMTKVARGDWLNKRQDCGCLVVETLGHDVTDANGCVAFGHNSAEWTVGIRFDDYLPLVIGSKNLAVVLEVVDE